ncbi:unnamed protein product [Paramecium pentaurelia]|uniref:Uncharacterized protein n=1 Tax=Paramecium pentaurelia TaxID=43138 RepID=A0A8S1WU18_9CILI|nr:unnamed protein product [Paramecium pentaurelia]
MEKLQFIITTLKIGDDITYQKKKGNHLQIHFQDFINNQFFYQISHQMNLRLKLKKMMILHLSFKQEY